MKRLIACSAATGALLTGALMTGALASPATAGSIRMHDPVGDTGRHGYGDVRLVRLQYGAHRLSVTIRWPASGDPEHFQDLYVDTRRAERTPDLVISSNGDDEGWDVGFVRGWRSQRFQARCSGAVGSVDYDYTRHVLRYSVPRTCLMHRGADQPARLRASLVTRTEQDVDQDWVPARRTFGRWIHWK